MAYVIPAIRGQMGSTIYYEGMMPARELVSAVRPASELDEWASLTIEDRMQRELDTNRIHNEIVPYLTKSADRFFGSVIILVHEPKIFEFEPLGKLLGKAPLAYGGASEKMGFITLDGGQLIVLDGQHRIVALREVIEGKGKPDGEFVPEVPSDEVCVIFLRHEENEKTRRIFNKVNRYAKPTSRADNIITSEDDGYAIVARRLMRKGAGPFGIQYKDSRTQETDLIVDWKNNTITGRSQRFTTVSVLYETGREILAHEGVRDFDEKSRVQRPSDEELDKAYGLVADWWETILAGMTEYHDALDEVKSGNAPSFAERREDEKRFSLLFKPAGQIALVKGLVRAVERGMPRDEAIRRVNKINWQTGAPAWRGSIVTASGRMSTSKQAYDLAAEMLAYLVGAEKMSKSDIAELKRRYNEALGYNYKKPEPGTKVEELPAPVA